MCIPQFLLGEDEKSKKVTALLTNGISCCIFAAHLKLSSMNTNQNEIILYQPNESIKLDVRIEHETVWLTQAQMVILFQSTKQNISLHVNNIFKENELDYQTTVKEYLTVQKEGNRHVSRFVKYYNLDVIISVGYRVKSQRGTQFRIWANSVLKDYLLRGYAINYRLDNLETKVFSLEQNQLEIKTIIQKSLPQKEGIFFNGQIFDAYVFISDLIKSAKKSIFLIDNYIDETVLLLLSKRLPKVCTIIYTKQISPQLQLDLTKHNTQYEPINIYQSDNFHDRFLIIDDVVYHIGASLKDLGKKLFAFSKMEVRASVLLNI